MSTNIMDVVNEYTSMDSRRRKVPLTKKGKRIKKAMQRHYGKKKGEEVFYASANKGTITGVHHSNVSTGRSGVSSRISTNFYDKSPRP